jgi:hypothetical protein
MRGEKDEVEKRGAVGKTYHGDTENSGERSGDRKNHSAQRTQKSAEEIGKPELKNLTADERGSTLIRKELKEIRFNRVMASHRD